MAPRLSALRSFLSSLGISLDNLKSLTGRKEAQKYVYLSQLALADLDLGYRFSWYQMGPYSPQLARDYYRLMEVSILDGEVPDTNGLSKQKAKRLEKVSGAFAKPSNVDLNNHEWLELIASLHYLLHVSTFDREKAFATIAESKIKLSQYSDEAMRCLESARLI